MNFPYQTNIPIVIQSFQKGDRYFDICCLLAERIIFGNRADRRVSNLIVAQMLFLDAEDPNLDITLYINNAGGSVTAAMALMP